MKGNKIDVKITSAPIIETISHFLFLPNIISEMERKSEIFKGLIDKTDHYRVLAQGYLEVILDRVGRPVFPIGTVVLVVLGDLFYPLVVITGLFFLWISGYK